MSTGEKTKMHGHTIFDRTKLRFWCYRNVSSLYFIFSKIILQILINVISKWVSSNILFNMQWKQTDADISPMTSYFHSSHWRLLPFLCSFLPSFVYFFVIFFLAPFPFDSNCQDETKPKEIASYFAQSFTIWNIFSLRSAPGIFSF